MMLAGTAATCICERTATVRVCPDAAVEFGRQTSLRHFLTLLALGQAVLPGRGQVSRSFSHV